MSGINKAIQKYQIEFKLPIAEKTMLDQIYKARLNQALGLFCRMALFGVFASIAAATAFAQDNKKQEFFPKNFAQNPLESSSTPFPTRTPLATLVPSPEPSAMPSKAGETEPSESASPSPSSTPEDDQTAGSFDTLRTHKVASFGLILNSEDTAHAQANLDRFFALAQEHKLPVGKVYLLASLETANRSGVNLLKLLSYGADLELVTRVPERYHVQKSPTWLVQTQDGEFVLEAVGSIERYFNAKHEFLEPRTE